MWVLELDQALAGAHHKGPVSSFQKGGEGGEGLDSPSALTKEAKTALKKAQSILASQQAHRCHEGPPFLFIILGKLPHLHGLIFQWDTHQRNPLLITELVFLGRQSCKSITRPQELMAQLITNARVHL